jgi:GT2 family glycosyltransferase
VEAATPSDGAPPNPTQEVPAAVPPAVVVLVAHNPGDWFRETLESIAAQTYPDLSVLIVDAASDTDVAPLVAEVLPAAHIHRIDHNPGFGPAANLGVELVDGAAFYALCHDDVALEPDTIRALVEEAFRSNAGIIGPKLVDWNDPRRLLQVGSSVDKTGALAPISERLELDQEQHDAIRDVFVVPGGCTVVRADLFEAIGGFDDQIAGLGDDLDLCWRAHVVGARVLIAPVTRVRHLEALGERVPVDDRRRQLARHRLRSSLANYGRWHRLRVIPQAALFAFVEVLYALIGGHPQQARDIASAWPWNLRRMGQIRARRKAVRAMRTVSDREVRELQVRGSARLSAFIRGQIGNRDDRVTTVRRSSRDVAGSLREGGRQLTTAFAAVLGVLLLVSSRDLIFDGIPAIGQFARMPSSPSVFTETWWSGWRHAGLGSAGAQPTGDGLLGVLGYLFLGALGLLRTVLILGTVPVGALGAWRLAKPIGSTRASVASFAVYLAIPVPYNAIAEGSWSGLLVYALAPWLLLALGRASGAAPFGPAGAAPDERAAHLRKRSPLHLILGLGLGLAVVATLVPFVIVVAVAVAAALTLGSILCFRIVGLARMLLVALGASALAVVLNLPWALDLVAGPSPWASIAGVPSASTTPLTLGEILRFETGPWGAPPLGWAFLLAGALPVIIGRSWRLEWAVRAWLVVLGGWAVLWASQQGHLPGGLPSSEVILAPVAAALALAAALGLAAFETDLRAYRFGWRQVLAVTAAIGVVLGAAPLASGLLDGRWRTPTADYQTGMADLIADTDDGAFRVLWLGDPAVLPVAGWTYDDHLAYGTSDAGVPTMIDRFTVPESGATPLIGEALQAAADRRTSRLGRLLGPMGVRYLVFQGQLAPTSEETAPNPAAAPTLDVLAQQLDLQRVPVADGLTVYRNLAWVPARAVLPEREGDRTRFLDAAGDDLTGAEAALKQADGVDGATGSVPETGDLLVASTADAGWKVRVDGVALRRSETYGWANQFGASRSGDGVLAYDTPVGHRAIAIGLAVLWILVLWAWRRARHRTRDLERAAAAAAPRPKGPSRDMGRLAEPEGVDA